MGEMSEMTTCEGCVNYEHCEGYDHAWIICQGKDFKPRPSVEEVEKR